MVPTGLWKELWHSCQQQLGITVTGPIRLFADPRKHQASRSKGSSANLQGVKCQLCQPYHTYTGTNMMLMSCGISLCTAHSQGVNLLKLTAASPSLHQTYYGLYFRLLSFLFDSLSKTGMFKRTGKATKTVFKLQWRLAEREWDLAIPAGLWRCFRMKKETCNYRKHNLLGISPRWLQVVNIVAKD